MTLRQHRLKHATGAETITVTKKFSHSAGMGLVTGTEEGIIALEWELRDGCNMDPHPHQSLDMETDAYKRADRVVSLAIEQLLEYFQRERTDFDLPLVLRGTEFQRAVWQELMRIPYGQTRSYKDVAIAIGRPKAVRAVGQANRANPLPIMVPCHRVIGANGDLVGYAGSKTYLQGHLIALETGERSKAD
jgi:O-6-methylguanine DNA methyltransferase